MTRKWKPGDRALLPVVVEQKVGEYLRVKWTTVEVGLAESGVIERGGWANAEDLIPDDRGPSWLPGQPGDVAEFDGKRWLRQADNWWFDVSGEGGTTDDDVPADAVLVLPARTREVES